MSTAGLLLPKNTLAHQLSRPLFTKRAIGAINCTRIAEAIKPSYNGSLGMMKEQTANPEQSALDFYGRNHGVALIMQRRGMHEPLPDQEYEFVKGYIDRWSVEGVRAFYYLMMIITREFRHGSSGGAGKLQKYGPEMQQFYNQLKKGGGEKKFLDNAPDMPLEKYVEAIEWGFTNLGFGGGFGGKPWAMIANCTRMFVTGQYTLEVMLDTIWTLSHNNGPIFNKGMYYTMYNSHMLLKILDVQRSGQIPQLVTSAEGSDLPSDSKFMKDMMWLTQEFDLGNEVDWQAVQDLGAVGNYSSKAKYQADHGFKKKSTTKKMTTFDGDDFYVMPKLTVKKFKKQRSAA